MLYLSGIILAFFLSLILAAKKNKSQADYILLAWLVMQGMHLCAFYLALTQHFSAFPTFMGIGVSLPLVHGPFLYLYTCQQTSSEPFKAARLWHFLPFLLSILMFYRFYAMSADEKVWVFEHKGAGLPHWQLMANLAAVYCSGIIYIALSATRLLRYRRALVQQFSNTERINFNWLIYLILWLVAIWSLVLFVGNDQFVFGAASIFVLWLGYFGIRQVQVFHNPLQPVAAVATTAENAVLEYSSPLAAPQALEEAVESTATKYQKSNLREENASLIHQALLQLLTEKKPFLNAELTLDELAAELQVHPNHLSQVINARENKNFYELINEMRVREFIETVAQADSRQYTLLAIAYDCGFNSKASFNRNFKRYVGLTPSEYLRSANL